MTVLNNAIKLAQTHLEQMDEDADEPVLKVQEENEQIAALKLELQKTQKQVAAMQVKPGGASSGAAGDKRKRDGGRGGGQRPDKSEWETCSICNKKHAGNPPKSRCFERDL